MRSVPTQTHILAGGQAIEAEEMLQEIEAAFGRSMSSTSASASGSKWSFFPGRNPNIECMRPMLQPVRWEHRPLLLYAIFYVLHLLTAVALQLQGYQCFKLPMSAASVPSGGDDTPQLFGYSVFAFAAADTMCYWYKPPAPGALNKTPLVGRSLTK
jgi:hypothetical protein